MNAAGAIARTAGVLGHELRNPLAAAVTGTALLREMLDADDPRRGVVDGVAKELERLGSLIDGYLDLARCVRPRSLPIAVERLGKTVAARHAQIAVDIDGELLARGDAVLIERALENLVENAFTAGAMHVRLGARRVDQRVEIVVEDDGPGVPPQLRGRIFAPGYSRTGSTGLGLSIVAEIATAHGGSVRCEAVGRGARFVLSLPLHEPAAIAALVP